MLASLLITLAAASGTLAATSLNSALTRSMFGLGYSADGVILPYCGAEQSAVTNDVLLMAQLTPRIRLYASDCNQTALVLQAIQDTNADLSVHLGIYIDGNDTVYQRQVDAIVDAIAVYGTDHINGVIVGNEYLLNSYGDGLPTSAAGIAARTKLLAYIQSFNATIQGLNLSKNIPIGTADAGSAVTTPLCAGADFIMANVHPWFGSVAVAEAAVWTTNFFKEFDTDICAASTTNNATMYIAETGWPTASDNATDDVNGAGSPADLAGLQTFLDTFICSANDNSTNYFFFEFKDETWKAIYGGVEQHWGLFYPNRTLKAVTIPTCEVTSPTGGTVAQLKFSAGTGSSASGSSTASGASTSSTSTSSSNTGGAGRSASLGGPAWIIAAGALLVGLPMI